MTEFPRLTAVLVAFFALAALALPAQELAVPPPGSPRLTFDVISIHPSEPSGEDRSCTINARQGGDGYVTRCVPVSLMISVMYKIPLRQISGAPAWVSEELFDIDAKADKPYSLDELHAMFQSLLADRFGLKFHTEKQEGNIYALTLDKSGLKMKPNDSPWDFKIPFRGGPDGYTGVRVPINFLCWWLENFVRADERPVINMTGLTGNYDFKLAFLPNYPPDFDKSQVPPEYLDRPDLFTALREQLGLKLTAQKGPVTYIVVDHAAKPSEN